MSAPKNPREVAAAVVARNLWDLETARLHLPLNNPDRHDLDPMDAAFAALAPGHPDLEASRAAGFEEKSLDWGEQPPNRRPTGYTSPDCEPVWAPKPAADVKTGGRL